VGDAAGYATQATGEGIYFAAKSGRMAAQEIVKLLRQNNRLPTEKEIEKGYIKKYDAEYGQMYRVLTWMQKSLFCNNNRKEAFVEICKSEYFQRVTLDAFLHKRIQGTTIRGNLEMLWKIPLAIWRHRSKSGSDRVIEATPDRLKRLGSSAPER